MDWKRIAKPLASRKVRVALATILGAYAAHYGLGISEEMILTLVSVGVALILGIAHEDHGRNAAGGTPPQSGRTTAALLMVVLAAAAWPGPAVAQVVTTRPSEENVFEPGIRTAILLRPEHSGTPEHPTILRAREKWATVIRPEPPYVCGIYAASDQVVGNVVIDGFTITGCTENGISFVRSPGITVMNCLIVGNRNQGIAAHYCDRLRLLNNVLIGNGTPGSNHRHGCYFSGDGAEIRGNDARGNSGFGFTGWPNATNALVEDNLIIGHMQPQSSGIGLGRTDEDLRNANVIRNNTLRLCNIGITVHYGAGDWLIGNATEACTNSISLYPAARAPVMLSANRLNVAASDLSGLAVHLLNQTATRPTIGE